MKMSATNLPWERVWHIFKVCEMLQLKPSLESPALTFVVLSLLFCSFYSLRTLCRALRYASGNPHGNALRSIYEVVLGFIYFHSLAFTCIHSHSLAFRPMKLKEMCVSIMLLPCMFELLNVVRELVCFTANQHWFLLCRQTPTRNVLPCSFSLKKGYSSYHHILFFSGLLLEFPDPVRQVFTSLSENSD